MNINRKALFLIVAAVVIGLAAFAVSTPRATQAEDFENLKNGAVKWKVIDYNRVTTHPARIPFRVTNGPDNGIGFDFLYTPDTALLGTSHPTYRGDLWGDLTGKTVNAKVGVTVTDGNPVFTYYGQPSCGDNPSANVRLYFETDTSGKFEYTDYWWSNPIHANLEDLKNGSDQTLTAAFSNPAIWSDWNGQFGYTDPAAFAAAVKDVKFVGLSFGGGCFFENGVGVQQGTGAAYFRLMDFTVSP